MRYLPHTPEDVAEMLQAIGMQAVDDLFETIPADSRRSDSLNLPEALTEWELNDHMSRLVANMGVSPEYQIYMGAGSYEHFIPASITYLLGRSEFSTAYTPYQPEISQGTLQAIYEYQTLTSRLLGMEVANASMYDGASALAEALLMALRINRKKKTVAVSKAIHPLYRRVVDTYFAPTGFSIVELPYAADGRTDCADISKIEDLAAVAIQSPNFFGCMEDIEAAGQVIHHQQALMVVCFTEPLAYGLYKNPGLLGADIACGEGQSLGIPRSFGGPGLGMFASRSKFMRNMPGRLVGQTKDVDGKRGFVLTLATREQHIRREKATSNICSNQGLCATTAAMYMSTLGGTGIRQLAQLNFDKCEYLKQSLTQAGYKLPFNSPSFNEFIVQFPEGFANKHQQLMEKKKIVAGLPLETYYPELASHYLLCVTETFTKDKLDQLVKEVQNG
jgi:glycine dehydrogenase subunit 1